MAKRPVVGSYVMLTKAGKAFLEDEGSGQRVKKLAIAKLDTDDGTGRPFYIKSIDNEDHYWLYEGQIKTLKFKDCMKEEVLLEMIKKIGAKKVIKLLKQYRLTPKNTPDYMERQDIHEWIDQALTWCDTPQGHGYWYELHEKLQG